jgi:anti-sigma-K factor RskA
MLVMSSHESIDQLASEYVLGTLDAEQRHAVQQQLEHDDTLARAVSEWEARLLPLVSLATPHPPSESLWHRIATSIGHPSCPHSQTARWVNSLTFWKGLSLAGLCATILMAVLLWLTTTASRHLVVLVTPQSHQPGWLVQSSTQDALELVPLTTDHIPQGKTLEFWTQADGWEAPVSLGLVQPGHPVHISLQQLPPLQTNQRFELTLEREGGSPTGQPTGPIQFIGRMVHVSR